MNEIEAIELACDINKIIDPIQASEVLSFLNAKIVDLGLEEFEGEVAASNELAKLMHTEGKTNKVAEVEWKTGEIYRKWKLLRLELQKFRNLRNALRRKEETLMFTTKRTRESYGGYDRVIN